MSILRKRSAAHKVYIPANVRDNHYIQAQIPLDDSLYQQLFAQLAIESGCYQDLYDALTQQIFSLANQFEVQNVLLIANDKLVRVRFNQELHQWQTNQQILFFYDPRFHQIQKAFCQPGHVARKINLLFLAQGQQLRYNAAHYHKQVSQLLAQFCQQLNLPMSHVRVRDHQHLTYDLFAKAKGETDSQTHKLRDIDLRYQQQGLQLLKIDSALTYAIATLPLSRNIQQLVQIDQTSPDPYNPLYTLIADEFCQAAKKFNLNNGAVIANGLVPIVRNSPEETISRQGELQMLGYNVNQGQCGIICKWNASELVDSVQLIFVATQEHRTEHGYGRFLNHIEKALTLFATQLQLSPHEDSFTMRFHQHIGYQLAN